MKTAHTLYSESVPALAYETAVHQNKNSSITYHFGLVKNSRSLINLVYNLCGPGS